MGVTQIGRQQRHVGIDVDAGPIPLDQGAHREGVSQVVETGPTATGLIETGVADQPREEAVDATSVEPSAGRRQEEAGRFGVGTAPVPEPGVTLEGVDGDGMQGKGSALVELRVPYRHDPLV